MSKKVCLKDIAKEVGVSTALVSYVLNNLKEGRISKEIAYKIKEAAKRLNYRPNQIAKSLKTSKTNTIGLIVADISNPFSSGLARIIEDEANAYNYTVIFGSSDENLQKSAKLIDTFMNRQVDGLIISPPADSMEQVEDLISQHVPFVLLDRYFPALKTNYVILDNLGASARAARHLVDSGCSRIGMVTYTSNLVHLKDREQGFVTAIKESGLPTKKSLIKHVDISNDAREITKSVKDLLFGKEPVDGLLLGSNRIAAHSLQYINSLPIKVPGDLAVVSFDETESLDLFYSPLTYIRQPLQEMGQMATNILLGNINMNNRITQVAMEGELVIRASSRKNG